MKLLCHIEKNIKSADSNRPTIYPSFNFDMFYHTEVEWKEYYWTANYDYDDADYDQTAMMCKLIMLCIGRKGKQNCCLQASAESEHWEEQGKDVSAYIKRKVWHQHSSNMTNTSFKIYSMINVL